MARGGATRFQPGQSGNPGGRPKARRPHVSAFDIVIDQTLTVKQNGVERELSIDEALELQTYQAALGGSRMAIRKVLKMIEKREQALAKKNGTLGIAPIKLAHHYDSDNANEAMRILGIMQHDPDWGEEHPRPKLTTWAAQAALSRPGGKKLDDEDVTSIKMFTMAPDKLKWPRKLSK